MPINFDLEELRLTHNCINYFETGLWDPRDDVSSKKALSCGFDNIFCIEIRKDWVDLGKVIFKNEIETNRFNLILDDSVNMHKYIDNDIFINKTIFFLDAHVDNDTIQNYTTRVPLFYELEAIKKLKRKDNIILIDDLRIINTTYPWNETRYGNINFLDKIKELILSINEKYKFSTLNGIIENDVLIAYI